MASMFRSGSSRRKPDVSANIRIQFKAKSSKGNDSDDVEEIDDVDSDDGDENLPVTFGNGVSEGVRNTESAKETPLKKKQVPARIDTSVLGNVCCSACGRQVNPYKNGAVQKHSELKVVICKHCSKFLSSGEISKDQDGADEQCRWCGEGGRLLVCDECSSAFCKSCVMRNFSRSEFNHINDLDRWLCYLCNQKPLQSLQENYRKIRDTLKALQEKQKAKSASLSASPASTASQHSKKNAESKQTPKNTMSSGRVGNVISNNVSVGGDAPSSMTLLSSEDLNVAHKNVDATIDKLTTATNTLREVLHALRSQSLSSVSGSQNTEMRRKQQARALNKSLETFLKSLKTILTEPEVTDDDSDVQVVCTKSVPLAKSTPVSMGPKSYMSSRSTMTPGGVLKKADAKHGSNENSESKKSESNASSDNIVGITDILPGEVPSSKTRSRTNSVTNINGDITKRRSSLISSSESSKDSVIKTASTKSSSGSSKDKTKDDDADDSDENAGGKRNTRQNSEKSHSKDKNKVSDTSEASQNHSRKEKHASEKTVSENGDADEAPIDSDASIDSPEKEKTLATSKTSSIPDDENMAAKFDLIKEITDEIARDNGGLDQENEDNEDNEDDDLPMMFEGHPTSKSDGETKTVNRKKAHASSSDEDTTKVVKKSKKSNSVGVKRSVSESNDKKDKEDKKKNENSEVDDSSSDPLSSADEDTAPRTRRHTRKATGKEKENKKTTEKKTSEKSTKVTSSKQSTAKTKKSENDEKPSEVDEIDNEIDKEIAKLSKLPTRRKRKASDTDEDDPKEKESTSKKAEERPVKRAKPGPKSSKKGIDYDDLSSDEHEKKDDDDDVEEDDDDVEEEELPVSFFGNAEETDEQQPLDENEIAKKGLLEDTESENDDNEEAEGVSSSDEESDKESTKRTKKVKIAKIELEKLEDVENEDNPGSEKGEDSDENIGKRKKAHSKLLDAKLSDSDSDIGSKKKKKEDADANYSSGSDKSSGSSSSDSNMSDEDGSKDSDDDEEDSDTKSKKKGKKKGKKNKKGKGKKNESEDESSEEDGKKNKKGKGKTRRRIKKMSNSSDEGGSEGGDQDDGDDDPNNSKAGKRKQIRKVMSNKRLDESTRAAAKAEEKRRKRIEAKQREFNIETITDENNPMNCPITTKLVLEASKEEGNEPIIEVNRDLVRKLKPHQVEAVQFMWDCLYESVKRAKKGDGAGCILAHCMGLGKTLSVIAFVHTILTHEKLLKHRTCLIVSPLNTVLNWKNEWSMWFEEEDQLEVWELAGCKQNALRAKALRDWHESGGIMIIGYEMYRNLTKGARCKNKKQKATFQETLVNPGPDLVICDEGHILKNEASAISKAMNLMKTKRRVVLTGTPLQNNLTEYHCMLSFVKPNLLGTRKEFTNRFIAPILNGQCADSTQADVKLMKARAHVLHEMLAGCVQRRDYSSLTKFLPPKQEYVISVRLTNIQIELYEKYLELTGQGVDGIYTNKGARLFRDYQNLMKIWTHPWVLKLAEIRDELKARYDDEESFIDDDTSDDEKEMSFSSSSSSSDKKSWSDSGEEGTSSKKKSQQGTRRTRAKARRDAGEDSDPEEVIAEWKSKSRKEVMEVEEQDKTVTRDWWAAYVSEDDQLKLELSNKLYLLFEILRMCEEIGDKVLIFSQSILSLNIIESFLEVIDAKFQKECENLTEEEREKQGLFGRSWTKNLDYYRMDGSTSAQQRQAWASSFNDMDNYRTRLFLISTRAGGLGINLVAANRVIIFDASWNPSHDVQSIFRVYRFGQIKPCYIYRFLAQGTMEEKIYERQVTKLSLSQRVVDEHQIERHFSANDLKELYNFRPDRWDDGTEKPTLSLPKDPLLAEILTTSKQCVVSFHEHDSLLENQVEQTLTEEEKKAAWEEYENEKKGIVVKGPGMDGRTSSWPMMAAAQLLSREQIAATVEALRQQLPEDVSENLFQLHLQQALRKQVQIKQEEMKRLELLRLQELNYLMMNQPGGMSGGMSAGMSRNQLMQNMTPWLQQMRAMQQNAMFMGGGGSTSGFTGMNQSAAGINRPKKSAKNPISNKPEDAIDLDDN